MEWTMPNTTKMVKLFKECLYAPGCVTFRKHKRISIRFCVESICKKMTISLIKYYNMLSSTRFVSSLVCGMRAYMDNKPNDDDELLGACIHIIATT